MGTAAQIRSYRVRAGKSAREVARHLGLNDAWYHDIEHHDDELASTLTLFQALELASVLGVRLRDLLSEDVFPEKSISLAELPSRINAHMASKGISIEQFEEEVGWDLHGVMESPIKAAAESPLIFLQALAEHLRVSWLALVPDEPQAV